MNELKV